MMTEDDTFDALRRPLLEDEIKFGKRAWIYCDQHRRAHQTGWCTVDNIHKTGLEAKNADEAYTECCVRGLILHRD